MATRRAKQSSLDFENADDAPPTLSLLAQIVLVPFRAVTSPAALRTYASTALLILATASLYFVAVVAYVIFYNAYIPDANFIIPVHLQFDHLVHSAALDPAIYRPHAVAAISTSSSRSFGRGRTARFFSADADVHAARDISTTKPGRIVSGLEYDIDVVMSLPRSPTNLAAGNFMLELSMLGPSSSTTDTPGSTPQFHGSGSSFASAPTSPGSESNAAVLAHSSRPATLTYSSPLLSYAMQILTMPLYVLKFRSESENLRIPMLERIAFASHSSSPVPEQVRLEIKSRERLQVYAVAVEVQARFAGIRWLMSRHRILSFALFTSLFWCGEMAFMLIVWGITSFALSSPGSSSSSQNNKGAAAGTVSDNEARGRTRLPGLKSEDANADAGPDLSDTERSFPTYSRQPPLRYSSPPQVKKEEEEDEGEAGATGAVPLVTTAGEADDEDDEDADYVLGEPGPRGSDFHDSGLGTSVESSAGSARRRKSNK